MSNKITGSGSWENAIRRIAAGEPVTDVLDAKAAMEREGFRAFLAGLGPKAAEALRQYNAQMRDLDTGITGARSAWHSISDKARRVILAVSQTKTKRIVRRSFKPSVYVLNGGIDLLCRVRTVRNLCARDLMAWDGGTFDPEQAAVLTERAVFIIAHGREGADTK